MLKGPAICFLRDNEKQVCGERYGFILHLLILCKQALIKEDPAFSEVKTRKETWQYEMHCVTLAFGIVFCMREKE